MLTSSYRLLTVSALSLATSTVTHAAVYSSNAAGPLNWSVSTWNPAMAGDAVRYNGNVSGGTNYTLDVNATVGSLRAEASGNPFQLLSDGTHTLSLDGTGISGTDQVFGNAGVASITQSNGNISNARAFTVGSSTTGMTINLLTDTDIGITTNTGSSMTIYGSINNTSGSSKTLTFRANYNAGNTNRANINIFSSIGTSGSSLAIVNAGTGGTASGTSIVTLNGVLGNQVSSVTQNSTTSLLVLTGANTYTGNTTVITGGTLQLNSSGKLTFQINPDATNNQLTGGGTANLNGSFQFLLPAEGAVAINTTWQIENLAGLTGAYGSSFSVVGFTDAGSDTWTLIRGSETWVFSETSGQLSVVIPEPACLSLIGLAGMGILRRRH
ncbi:MAG: hypothetical protein KatS3mg104_2548 [Phycisphaerae bacterium]|nr:MAG: hypothetical protein KatS3mg104_2548 [Phycisphaerae bacterium]